MFIHDVLFLLGRRKTVLVIRRYVPDDKTNNTKDERQKSKHRTQNSKVTKHKSQKTKVTYRPPEGTVTWGNC